LRHQSNKCNIYKGLFTVLKAFDSRLLGSFI
jgi:hypothetical protein